MSARSPVDNREHVVFLAAVALLGLHVVDDGFLQPESGTSPADHVLYVGVALGLLVTAAVVFARVRPVARALLAAVLGAVCLTYGGVAIGEARGQGLTGHDYSGLLLAPAGVVLLALSAWTLWTSRRDDGGRLRRYARRALVAGAAVVVGLFVVMPLVIAIIATHRPRVVVSPADLGRPYDQVMVRTADGLDLAAWYVPSENGAAVIVFPGRTSRVPHGRMLAEAGYGVLMVDMRGQGESEGDPNLFGWDSPKDLDAAIAFLRGRPDVTDGRIGGIGFSVGGEQMIQAAAENPGLRAVVSEGAGERSWREASLRGPAGWPALVGVGVSNVAIAVISGDAPPPSLEDLVERIAPRPLFLIYARHGQGGEDLNPEYFEAAGNPKQIWEIPSGGHTGGLEAEGEEYRRRVLAFFDEALGVSR